MQPAPPHSGAAHRLAAVQIFGSWQCGTLVDPRVFFTQHIELVTWIPTKPALLEYPLNPLWAARQLPLRSGSRPPARRRGQPLIFSCFSCPWNAEVRELMWACVLRSCAAVGLRTKPTKLRSWWP